MTVDNVPTKNRPSFPPVTRTIAVICLLVWLGQLFIPGVEQAVLLTDQLGRWQPWRFITSAFAHSADLLQFPAEILSILWYVPHIAMNMLILIGIGRFLEPALGSARFLALYLLSAIGGGLAFVIFTPGNYAVTGASGAVFGLFGALARFQQRPDQGLLVLIGFNIAFGFMMPGIAWQAHIGGLLVGVAVAQIFTQSRTKNQTIIELAIFTALLLAIGVLHYWLA